MEWYTPWPKEKERKKRMQEILSIVKKPQLDKLVKPASSKKKKKTLPNNLRLKIESNRKGIRQGTVLVPWVSNNLCFLKGTLRFQVTGWKYHPHFVPKLWQSTIVWDSVTSNPDCIPLQPTKGRTASYSVRKGTIWPIRMDIQVFSPSYQITAEDKVNCKEQNSMEKLGTVIHLFSSSPNIAYCHQIWIF